MIMMKMIEFLFYFSFPPTFYFLMSLNYSIIFCFFRLVYLHNLCASKAIVKCSILLHPLKLPLLFFSFIIINSKNLLKINYWQITASFDFLFGRINNNCPFSLSSSTPPLLFLDYFILINSFAL